MKPSIAQFLRQPHRRIVAAVLAFSIFGLGLLAVVPNWHEAFHHDAHHANHSCAVDLLAHGSSAGAPLLAVEAPVFVSIDRWADHRPVVVESIALRRPPGRAPPVA